MNDFGEVCYVVSKHETHNAVPLHKIHYIFCSKNGNVIMEVDNGFSYERKHVSAINIHQIDLFSQYIFEIYEQTSVYTTFLSPYLYGFRKRYNTEY